MIRVLDVRAKVLEDYQLSPCLRFFLIRLVEEKSHSAAKENYLIPDTSEVLHSESQVKERSNCE